MKTTLMTRRTALKTAALAAAACAAAPRLQAQSAPAPTGPFKLPALPYAFDALEPHLDARTMEIHHDKHHAAYVANLNKAVADDPQLSAKSIEELLRQLDAVPEKLRPAVRNQGGGHLNHSLFWQMLKKDGGGPPKGEVAGAIDKSFGSFEAFKAALTKAAVGQFGSGWAWLSLEGKALKLEASANTRTRPGARAGPSCWASMSGNTPTT
jgi:Fe-Mn family superoxide dismutase